MEIRDRTVLEAASWRLASELVRRHPDNTRLLRGHPGGGQYDLLWIRQLPDGDGDVSLNRNGTIQVNGRFDGGRELTWRPTEWSEYLAEEPLEFLEQLEAAASLRRPSHVPAATPTTLTYRVLAAVAATGTKTVHPIDIQQGYIDTSGDGGGHNELLDGFDIDSEILRTRGDDLFGEPGYRFWVPSREEKPMFVIEQTSAMVWFNGSSEPLDAFDIYRSCGRNVEVTTSRLLIASVGVGL